MNNCKWYDIMNNSCKNFMSDRYKSNSCDGCNENEAYDDFNRCVCCNEIIPEGRQICKACELKYGV